MDSQPWRKYGIEIRWVEGGASSYIVGADIYYQGKKLESKDTDDIYTTSVDFDYWSEDLDYNGIPEIVFENKHLKWAYYLELSQNKDELPVVKEKIIECYHPGWIQCAYHQS